MDLAKIIVTELSNAQKFEVHQAVGLSLETRNAVHLNMDNVALVLRELYKAFDTTTVKVHHKATDSGFKVWASYGYDGLQFWTLTL